MLRFSEANNKTKQLRGKRFAAKWLRDNRKVYSLDLSSGWSCPFARDCRSKAVVTPNGIRIKDGPDTKFRCFSASQEALFPKTFALRMGNFEAVRQAKTKAKIVKLILSSMPKDAGIVRWHVAGDFFSKAYFEAALEVARRRPDILFYCYTKALGYWFQLKDSIPANFVVTASYGGVFDPILPVWSSEHNLKTAIVVKSESEARKLGLVVDHDDSHAANPGYCKSFALVVHGVQPKGSDYAKIVTRRNRS